jgi:hypothetical protein
MAKNSSLIKMATSNKKVTPAKEEVKEVVPEVVLTKEEARDLKAKEVVKNLLSESEVDLSLTTKPKEDLLEVVEDEKPQGSGWLEEQVALLTSENELLRAEVQEAQMNYQKIFNENQRIKAGQGIQDDSDLKQNIMRIFHELQSNYMKMGMSNQTRTEVIPAGEPNFRIAPAAFINRLIVFFPFLQKEKRF